MQNPATAASSVLPTQTASAQGAVQPSSGEATRTLDFSQTLSNSLSGDSSRARPGTSSGAQQTLQGAPAAVTGAKAVLPGVGLPPGGLSTQIDFSASRTAAAAVAPGVSAKGTAEKPGFKAKDSAPGRQASAPPSHAGANLALSLIGTPLVPPPPPVAIGLRSAAGVARESASALVAVTAKETQGELAATAAQAQSLASASSEPLLPSSAAGPGAAAVPGAIATGNEAAGGSAGAALSVGTQQMHQQASGAVPIAAVQNAGAPKNPVNGAESGGANAPSPAAATQTLADSQGSANQSSEQSSGRATPTLARLAESAAAFAVPPMPAQAQSSALQAESKPPEQSAAANLPGGSPAAPLEPGVPQISSASMLQSLHGSEMRVGLHSPEFGSISIATTLSPGNVAAQITLDHSALSRALAVHLPGIEEKLGSALGVTAKVEMQSGGPAAQSGSSSGQAGSGGGAQTSHQQVNPFLPGSAQAARESPPGSAIPSSIAPTVSSQRLSIQA